MKEEDLTMGEIGRTIVRIETKLDRMYGDHEGRLRRVEAWMYAIPAAIITGVIGAVVAVVK